MNAAPLDPPNPNGLPQPAERAWSAGRWFAYVTLAFALHVGLFYALSDRRSPAPRTVKNAATMHLAEHQSEIHQLDDPTLFALPHPRGFAGQTWLRLPEISFAPFRWTEPPRLLALPVAQLGAVFLRHAETNAAAIRPLETTAPAVTTVVSPIDLAPARGPSTMRINGSLTGRSLRQPAPPLPAVPALDGLTNTVINVLVDARGQVVSPTLFHPGSGSREADQIALKFARNLWFKPVAPTTPLTIGRLIFEWQTLPPTNAPAATP